MWVPVYENNHLYIVLSKSIAELGIKCMVSTNDDLKPLFDSLKPAAAFAHNTGSDTAKRELFMNIMKKTPWGVKKTVTNKWVKNFEIVRIMDAVYFKGVMEDIVARFPERPTKLPRSAENLKVHMRYFPSTMSVSSGIGENVRYVNMGETLTPDDLSRMPAFGTNWWIQAYESGADRYFDMKEVDGKLGHVQSGVYIPPAGEVYARSYDDTMRMFAAKKAAAAAAAAARKRSNKRGRSRG